MEARKLILSFSGGFAIMVLELLGSRMLAPYFGNSTYVWGSLIGVFMIALAVGYKLGGSLADRRNDEQTLRNIILAGIGLTFVVGASYTYVLHWLTPLGDIKGSIVSSLILFGPPTALLAAISPYLIKILSKQDNVGATAGNIYAMSTAGSILGTFAAAFFLIPTIGTRLSLFASFSIFLAVTLLTLKGNRLAVLSAVLLLLYLVPGHAISVEGWDVVYEAESAYNFIQVLHREGAYKLRLNKENGIQTYQRSDTTATEFYFDYMVLAPLLHPSGDALILGAGAGANINQLIERFPSLFVDAVEIDARVIEAGERFFGLDRSEPRLRVFIEDARPFVKRADRAYGAIILDIYNGGLHIPFYVMTIEYFEDIKAAMEPGGVLAVNVLSFNEAWERDYTLVEPIAATLKSVFTHVYTLDASPANTILYASDSELSLGDAPPEAVLEFQKFEFARMNFREMEGQRGHILTDDSSDLEMLASRMLGKEE